LGFVSRIDEGKGWEIFLDVISQLAREGKKVQGIMIGDASMASNSMGKKDYKDKLLYYIDKLGLQNIVHYLGAVRPEELAYYYCKMDIFIFPTRYEESLGLVGLEAMSCGVPVVGTFIGGLKDYIIEGYNGFFFKKGNSIELIEKINLYIDYSIEDKEKMRKNCINTAARYETKKVSRELFNFLQLVRK